MELKIGKCPICGINHTLLTSNNPIVPPICTSCLIKNIDADNLEQANFFCKTYNIAFNPDLWIKMRKEFKHNVFKEYVSFFYSEKTGEYKDKDAMSWKKLDAEWKLVRTHEELVMKVETIKDGYMLRNQIKWGPNYSFSELIALESLFVSTLKANDVSNPMQIDAIKKACKMSVSLDRAITHGDSKEINDLSKAYQNFIKTARIDDLITAADQNVISNVAQLVAFIEDSGYEFKFYDNVSRDVVDSSLKDIQGFIRELVMGATGLESIFETIRSGVRTDDAAEKDEESFKKVSLEDLYQSGLDNRNREFDEELEIEGQQELDVDINVEEDEDEFF